MAESMTPARIVELEDQADAYMDAVDVYAARLWADQNDARSDRVVVASTYALLLIGHRRDYIDDPARHAREVLTELGEAAPPLRDEGVPCGY